MEIKPNSRKIEIVKSFVKLSERFGVEKTTISDVANEVGISVGAIYLDFKNKEEIIDAAMEQLKNEIFQEHQSVINSNVSTQKKLYALTVGHVESLSEQFRKNKALFDFLAGSTKRKTKLDNFITKQNILKNDLTALIQKVLDEGINLKAIKNIETKSTASAIFLAFESFRQPYSIVNQPHDKVILDAKILFDFIISSITE